MALVMFFLVERNSSSFSIILLSISCLTWVSSRRMIDRRMIEKDEEFLSTKKNMTKAIENMQSAVETESKAKAEALRMKKKNMTKAIELESNLERANAANAD